MRLFNYYILLIIIGVSVSFCKKKESENPYSNIDVDLILVSPTQGQEVGFNEQLIVNGRIEHPVSLHGYSVIITDADNNILFQRYRHTHGRTIDLWETWTNDLEEEENLTVQIIAHKDHLGNENVFNISVIGLGNQN
jgi:hypothetical protein